MASKKKDPVKAAQAKQADQGENTIPPKPKPPENDTASMIRASQERLEANRAPEAKKIGSIGPEIARYDAREKVMGQAQYAGDIPAPGAAYGYAVSSPVAKGMIRATNTQAAEAVPGVIRIYKHDAMKGRLKPVKFFNQGGPASTDMLVMSGPEIVHDNQIIGYVVAESYEAAREAANLVTFDIDEAKSSATFGDEGVTTYALAEKNKDWKDPVVGDAEAAFAQAEQKVEAEYFMPTQHHNPMELFSTTCHWEDERLIIHEPSAGVSVLKAGVSTQLGLKPENIDIISPYVGGSFGAKVTMTPRTSITALAARDVGRPVKCVLTRQQGFTQSTHRAETRHKVRLACDAAGKLTAYGHEAWEVTSRTDAYTVNGTENTIHMYAWPNATTKINVVEADRNTPGFMRSPPETPYIFALECAMDEMAEKMKIDPVEFRKLNDAQTTAYKNKAYTSRSLNQCLDKGAEAFGWSKRDPKVGSMRDGDWLIGYGVAMATYPTALSAAAVRIKVMADGNALVQVSAHDIGTGAYGVAAIVAAQELGLPIENVKVELGDSRLPPGPIAGGSNTTATISNAIAETCNRLRLKLGVKDGQSILPALKGLGAAEEQYNWAFEGAPPNAIETLYKGGAPFGGAAYGDKLRFAFGAEFVEVRINERTREIRVPRITGVFAAGRIINANTARSQLLGGMIWGIGSALHEATEIDSRAAKYTNSNIAEYLVPVNADIPNVEIIMLPEEDRETNALGVKGIGELGNVGTAAAIFSAVYHATGKRVRDLPIRIESLLTA